jgi:hypothetical protein
MALEGFGEWTQNSDPPVLLAEVRAILEERPVGKKYAMTNKAICLRLGISSKKHEVQVREAVHYLRVNDIIQMLCSDQKGYWKAESKVEVQSYLKSLDQRLSSIRSVRIALARQAGLILANGQTVLF